MSRGLAAPFLQFRFLERGDNNEGTATTLNPRCLAIAR